MGSYLTRMASSLVNAIFSSNQNDQMEQCHLSGYKKNKSLNYGVQAQPILTMRSIKRFKVSELNFMP